MGLPYRRRIEGAELRGELVPVRPRRKPHDG
jgi:hypothetical protein